MARPRLLAAIGRPAIGLTTIALTAIAACSPSLGETPFACGSGDTCPDGYTCRSTVCVRAGEHLPASRPERVVWINSAEMYWARGLHGGATLVVNDGFTPGAHGLYELTVSAAGDVSAPRKLFGYDDAFPRSSAVVALDDAHWGVPTLRFPDVDGDDLTLEVLAIDREASGTPAVKSLYTETTPFLGGFEPAYVGASAEDGAMDIAWTLPEGGGKVEVLHLAPKSGAWAVERKGERQLPKEILPLSGDCLLWRTGKGRLGLRVGVEQFAFATVDETSTIGPLELLADEPLYAFGDDALLLLHLGDPSAVDRSRPASYVLADPSGKTIDQDPGYFVQHTLEPYTAAPFGDGALVAPLSKDPSFPTLDVGFRGKATPLVTVASFPRESTDELYSARAFADGGKVYLAWTSFHEALMDLWIAVADASGPVASGSSALTVAPPRRALSFPLAAPPRRRR